MYYKKYIKYKTKYINLKREMEGGRFPQGLKDAAKKAASIAGHALQGVVKKAVENGKSAAIKAVAATFGHKGKAVEDPISKLLDDIENKIKDTKITLDELKKYTECKEILSKIKLSGDKLDEIKKIDMTDSKNLDTLYKFLKDLDTEKK